MKIKTEVVYLDGRTETITVRPGTIVKYEKSIGRSLANGTSEDALTMTWWAAGRPDGSFDAWLDSLDDWNTIEDEADDPDGDGPLAQTVPSGESSNSQSSQALESPTQI